MAYFSTKEYSTRAVKKGSVVAPECQFGPVNSKTMFSRDQVAFFVQTRKAIRVSWVWTPIRYVTLQFRDQWGAASFAPIQKSHRHHLSYVWIQYSFRAGAKAMRYRVNHNQSLIYSVFTHLCKFIGTEESSTCEKGSAPRELVWNPNMSDTSLFWNNNSGGPDVMWKYSLAPGAVMSTMWAVNILSTDIFFLFY